jgi:NAD(P)-dependent dehydrogenase (short-subunit alcohol dehydrogenase family)
MEIDLHGRTAVATGASRGVGLAAVGARRAHCANVVAAHALP